MMHPSSLKLRLPAEKPLPVHKPFDTLPKRNAAYFRLVFYYRHLHLKSEDAAIKKLIKGVMESPEFYQDTLIPTFRGQIKITSQKLEAWIVAPLLEFFKMVSARFFDMAHRQPDEKQEIVDPVWFLEKLVLKTECVKLRTLILLKLEDSAEIRVLKKKAYPQEKNSLKSLCQESLKEHQFHLSIHLILRFIDFTSIDDEMRKIFESYKGQQISEEKSQIFLALLEKLKKQLEKEFGSDFFEQLKEATKTLKIHIARKPSNPDASWKSERSALKSHYLTLRHRLIKKIDKINGEFQVVKDVRSIESPKQVFTAFTQLSSVNLKRLLNLGFFHFHSIEEEIELAFMRDLIQEFPKTLNDEFFKDCRYEQRPQNLRERLYAYRDYAIFDYLNLVQGGSRDYQSAFFTIVNRVFEGVVKQLDKINHSSLPVELTITDALAKPLAAMSVQFSGQHNYLLQFTDGNKKYDGRGDRLLTPTSAPRTGRLETSRPLNLVYLNGIIRRHQELTQFMTGDLEKLYEESQGTVHLDGESKQISLHKIETLEGIDTDYLELVIHSDLEANMQAIELMTTSVDAFKKKHSSAQLDDEQNPDKTHSSLQKLLKSLNLQESYRAVCDNVVKRILAEGGIEGVQTPEKLS